MPQEEEENWHAPVQSYEDDPEEQDPEDQVLDDVQEQMSIKEASFELIEKVLRKHGGNRKAAAAELKISERTLYRKLKQMQSKKDEK
jgi:DNA-binding NtrC family response regulator